MTSQVIEQQTAELVPPVSSCMSIYELQQWLGNITKFREQTADSQRACFQFHGELQTVLIGPERESPLLPALQQAFEDLQQRLRNAL